MNFDNHLRYPIHKRLQRQAIQATEFVLKAPLRKSEGSEGNELKTLDRGIIKESGGGGKISIAGVRPTISHLVSVEVFILRIDCGRMGGGGEQG